MRKIFTLLVMLISLGLTSEIIATNNQVVAKSTGCTSINGKGVATFVVTSPQAQVCDLSFLMMPGEYEDSSFTSVTLKVNGITLPNPITFSTYGWQPANTTGNAVSLSKGDNTVQFISGRDDVPMVRNIGKYVAINNNMFLNLLEINKTDENFNSTKETISNSERFNNNFASPELLYRSGVSVDTAYYNTFILPLQYSEGDTAVFYVQSNTATVDFNMYLFHQDPNTYSESSTCNGNRYLFFEDTINASGTYYLLLEAKNEGECGGVTILVNNSTLYRNSFVSNTSFDVLKSKDNASIHVVSQDSCYNIFTTNLKSADEYHDADSYLYLKKVLNNGKEVVVSYNDDNLVTSDFEWGKNARIRTILSDTNTYKVNLCSMYPYSYFTPDKCDIYHSFWCNAKIPEIDFDSLNYQDIIESGNMDVGFNCIAWSGGDNSYKIFPPKSHHSLIWFDKFYNNEEVLNSFTNTYYQRSPNMPKYVRCDITSEDAIIDVWGYISERGDTTFTHASIKNNQYDSIPHGYAWESKLGWGLIRIFHQRESIKGNTYGQILASYKITDSSNNLSRSIYEFVSENEIEIKKRSLSLTETEQLTNLSLREKSNSLEKLFAIWNIESNKMSFISNPDFFRELDVYKEIILKLYQLKEPIIYLFNKYISGTPLIELFISDVVDRSNLDIKNFWVESFIDEDNTIISAKSKINLFYKKILQLEVLNNTITEVESKISNADKFNVTTLNNTIQIEVEIDAISSYKIEIVDLKTSFIQTVVPETKVQAGEYEHIINVSSGNYVVVCYLNGNINTKKVVVK